MMNECVSTSHLDQHIRKEAPSRVPNDLCEKNSMCIVKLQHISHIFVLLHADTYHISQIIQPKAYLR